MMHDTMDLRAAMSQDARENMETGCCTPAHIQYWPSRVQDLRPLDDTEDCFASLTRELFRFAA